MVDFSDKQLFVIVYSSITFSYLSHDVSGVNVYVHTYITSIFQSFIIFVYEIHS